MNKEDVLQAQSDMEKAVESTKELIDLPFAEIPKFFEGKNLGVLKGYRTLLEATLSEVDDVATKLILSKVIQFNEAERTNLASVAIIIEKIRCIIGYIDYLYKKNSID